MTATIPIKIVLAVNTGTEKSLNTSGVATGYYSSNIRILSIIRSERINISTSGNIRYIGNTQSQRNKARNTS